MNHCNVKGRLLMLQRGWTLVELLVAMTLSLLVIAGIGKIYLAAKRSYDIQNSLARLQDEGRYATEVITQDIRQAGYWGVMNMQAAIGNITDPPAAAPPNPAPTCIANNTWGKMVTEKLFGLNDTSGNYTCISRMQGDVLTVRYGDPTTTTPYGGTALYMRATPLGGTIGTGPAGPVAAGAGPTSDLELVAHAYYVATSNSARECGKATTPFLPALDRESLITTGANIGNPRSEELVTGVEQLQFQFGVDTDGDPTHSVDQYMNADAVGNWPNVHSVRFWILVKNDCPDASYTDPNTYNMGDVAYTPGDNYRRALYTSTVTLRN